MIWPDQWNTTGWWIPTIVLVVLGVAATIYSYHRQLTSLANWPGMLVKVLAIFLLGLCLLEPKTLLERAVPGANSVVVMVDRSESLQLKDAGANQTRAAEMVTYLSDNPQWLQQLESDFQLRKYYVDQKLTATTDFDDFNATRQGSDLLFNLQQAVQRPSGKPLAAVVMLTDGNATDAGILQQWQKNNLQLPPIYPVLLGNDSSPPDLAIQRIVSSQSNFEAAPVTIQATVQADGFSDQTIVARLLSESGEELDRKEVAGVVDATPFVVQLRTTEKSPGVSAYQVTVHPKGKAGQTEADTNEATLVNNFRWVMVDRGRSPLRVLYVCGRPNWELKYLRRAVFDDEELELVALVRIAKRAAKFDFRGRSGQDSNALFRGFENQDDDTAERFDETVFVRLGTKNDQELRSGFPTTRSDLFQFDAVILDDVEATFFSQEQQTILQEFASVRGGGVLMLGGQESFQAGKYEKTGIGEMLPVYLNTNANPNGSVYRLALTREGWLQPWVRLQATEDEENQRLAKMPGFKILNPVRSIKPGATVLAEVSDENNERFPALVSQPFGRGRTAAWLLGDLWRWQLRSPVENDDLLTYWRQTMRWLVSDVPGRCELTTEVVQANSALRQMKVNLLDQDFLPLDNAEVNIEVTTPSGDPLRLSAKPSLTNLGQYEASFYSAESGVYRAKATAQDPASNELLTAESAWVRDPAIEEFQRLTPNRDLMNQVAETSGGKVINIDELEGFVDQLPNTRVPVRTTSTQWWWHRWPLFLAALTMLVGEWGLRRWKGLP